MDAKQEVDTDMGMLRKLKAKLEQVEKEKEEEKKQRVEAERGRDEEMRKRQEAEERNRHLEQRVAELIQMINKPKISPPPLLFLSSRSPPPPHPPPLQVTTSLDGVSVKFSDSDKIRREGNRIIHDSNSYDPRHCFIGGEMQSVCVY